MALNKETFRIRALSSVVFVILMLTCLWWNVWSFGALFAVIHFGCWHEYVNLGRKISAINYGLFLVCGVVYIGLPIALMLDLRVHGLPTGSMSVSYPECAHIPHINLVIPTGIIFSIWINDTMAYLVGSFIGKTPLSPISPKKTWEGTIGGIILCVVVMTTLGWATGFFSVKDWVFISLLCAIAGTFGDLFESKLKRLAGVKDSGSMMPGHGGFLDRFDSLLFAVPAVWVYGYLFMR